MKKDELLLLLKFGKKKNLEALQKGHFYTKNLKYYIECENKGGQGDEDEATLILNGIKAEAIDNKTNKIVFTCNSGKAKLRKTGDEYTPIFCMNYIDSEDLENIKTENNITTAILKFPKDKLERFKKEFGEYVLIISPVDFCNRIIDKFSDEIGFKISKVQYDDYSINNVKRFEDFSQNNSDRFFWKCNSFKWQKEYRIVFSGIKVDDNLKKDIGSIKRFTYLYSIDDLVNKEFTIKYELEK